MENKNKMHSLLLSDQVCLARDSDDLGICKTLSHVINTGYWKPIHQAPYSSAFKQRAIIQDKVNGMFKEGVHVSRMFMVVPRHLGHEKGWIVQIFRRLPEVK